MLIGSKGQGKKSFSPARVDRDRPRTGLAESHRIVYNYFLSHTPLTIHLRAMPPPLHIFIINICALLRKERGG